LQYPPKRPCTSLASGGRDFPDPEITSVALSADHL
jgi:hypothetical protein